MRIVLRKDLQLRGLNREASEFMFMIFKGIGMGVKYYYSSGDNDTRNVRIEGPQTINFRNESEATIIMNMIDAHCTERLKYIYLGNMKFDLAYDG